MKTFTIICKKCLSHDIEIDAYFDVPEDDGGIFIKGLTCNKCGNSEDEYI